MRHVCFRQQDSAQLHLQRDIHQCGTLCWRDGRLTRDWTVGGRLVVWLPLLLSWWIFVRGPSQAPPLVEFSLFGLAFFGLIKGFAAPVRLLATVVLPTAKGTTQVNAASIAGMGEKPDAAMATGNSTVLKVRIVTQNRVQNDLILTDKRDSAVVLVPILRKSENLLEGYDNKPSVSVMMLRLCTTSSYLFDAKASRGRARFFHGLS